MITQKDSHNRKIDYMRISITNQCSYRCFYCSNGEAICDKNNVMTRENIVRLCENAAFLGIDKIKITGGEPCMRADFVQIIADIKKIDGIKSVSITTNGSGLTAGHIAGLKNAHIDSVNISVDTLDEDDYYTITRTRLLDKVTASIEELCRAGIMVKINTVITEFLTQEAVDKLLFFSHRYGIPVRFIEMMPMGRRQAGPDGDYVRDIINRVGYRLETHARVGCGPARYFYAIKQEVQAVVGFIEPIHHKFCEQCNRIRVSEDGIIMSCLYNSNGISVAKALQDKNDEAVKKIIIQAINDKPKEHFFDKHPSEMEMINIGG